MNSKSFVSLLAIAPQRRLAVSAIVYGLSLAIRFTSATGEEVEIPQQSMQTMSIMTNDDNHLPYADWGNPKVIDQTFLRRRWQVRGSSKPSCDLND